jgi:hypothetical protein
MWHRMGMAALALGTVTACSSGATQDGGSGTDAATCTFCDPASSDNCVHLVCMCGESGACDGGQICQGGACVGECLIGGAVVVAGALDPSNPCLECQPPVSNTDWSPRPLGNACGTNLICASGQCVSGCFVSGTFYDGGAAEPGNACQTCEPQFSAAMLFPQPNGTVCDAGGVCQSGACIPGCWISGSYEAGGAINPGDRCQLCSPGSNPVGWSSVADGTACDAGAICAGGACQPGCFIGGGFFLPDAGDPSNLCLACEPGVATAAWTLVSDAGLCANCGNPLCVCDGGTAFDLAQVQALLAGICPAPPTGGVTVPSAVVTGVLQEYVSTQSGLPNDAGSNAFFWIADPQAPQTALWVEKAPTDFAADAVSGTDFVYDPQPGDLLTVTGFAADWPATGFAPLEQADRATVSHQSLVTGTPGAPLQLGLLGQGAPPPDNVVVAGFGNALGGTVAANPEYAGARVHIPGPLTITQGAPVALESYDRLTFPAAPNGWNGFEVGSPDASFAGILVDELAGCGYGAWVRDGGKVSFPNGVSGNWDTYAVQPCTGVVPDGGTVCPNGPGETPLVGGGVRNGFLYVLWPVDCTRDLDGGLN